MTFTVSELLLLLEALDMAGSRHQSQADYYEARPNRFTTASVNKHANKSDAMHALSCRLTEIVPRRTMLEVA